MSGARFVVDKRDFQKLGDDGKLFVIYLHDVGELGGFRERFRFLKGLAKIYVENEGGSRSQGGEKLANRGARLRATLCEGAEADGVGALGEGAPLRRPFEEIPSDIFRDFESGLAGGINGDFHGSSGMRRIDLNVSGANAETFEAATRGASEGITAHATGDNAFIAKRSEEHTSELQSPCNLVCRLLLEKKHASVIRQM